jgi:hypothetical protein
MYLKFSLAALFILSVACLTSLVQARADDEAKLDKKVVEIVMKAGDTIKNAKAFHTEGTIQSEIQGQEKQATNVAVSYDVERPNRIAFHAQHRGDKPGSLDMVSNGKTVITSSSHLKQYTEKDSPEDIEGIASSLLRPLGAPNIGLLFQNILTENPGEALMQGVTACSPAGNEKINGVDAHHLKFVQDQFDWELWVASEGTPYILQMKSFIPSDSGKRVLTETYKNWKINEPMGASAFSITPPKDAKKVDLLGPASGQDS